MYNNIILIGRLTADPELRTTPNGKNVCSFRIAVERPYKDGSGERPTDFIPCFCWGKDGENICSYFKKGALIGLDGSLQSREYTDKEDKKHYVCEVNVARWFSVGSKPKENGENA